MTRKRRRDGEFTLPFGDHSKVTRGPDAPPRYLDQPGPAVVRSSEAPEWARDLNRKLHQGR